MAISGEFATALQRLLEKLQTDQAELDFQEQVRRRLFGEQEHQLMQAKPLALRSANQSLADRGLVQSGIGLGQHGNIDRAFMENLAGLGAGHQDELSNFAKQRLSNQADYNWNFADLQRQWTMDQANRAATGTLAPPGTLPPVAPTPLTPQVNGPPLGPGAPVVKPRKKSPPNRGAGVTKPITQPAPKVGKPAGLTMDFLQTKVVKKPKQPVIGARGGY